MNEVHDFSALAGLGFLLLHIALRLRRAERERPLNERGEGRGKQG